MQAVADLRRVPIPDKLIRALGRAPLVEESKITSPVRLTLALSKRERETLLLLSHGCTLAQAGDALGLGYETVRTHDRSARFKLRAKNSTHAVAEAIRLGIIA